MRRLAALGAQMRQGPTLWLVGISLVAYLVLALQASSERVAALCSRVGSLGVDGLSGLSPGFETLAADWILMTVAMMSPLVGAQAAYVLRSVTGSQRSPAILAFVLGYLACWVLSGLVLVPAALALALAGGGFSLPVALAGALVWNMSPAAQWARNLCHRQDRIGAFGLEAQVDSCWLGLRTGLACVAACWPFMLVPLQVETGHVAVMMLTGLVLFVDRVTPPADLAWRLPPVLETLMGVSLLKGRTAYETIQRRATGPVHQAPHELPHRTREHSI